MAERIEEDQREIRARHQENEALLLNILPRPIATRLKQGEGQIADAFPQVGILFADLVEFTKLSSVTHPTELVALLNELFTEFDELMTRRGLEKIKTIGDCYMAVCGVPEPVDAPAHAMAEAALALQKSLARFNDRTGRSFQLRIGLNCGPVVAGVIGSSKFIYDLWGDTVNMASRMESTGQPGTIQLTEAMAEAIKDRFDVELRGTFDIKGKGPTSVWILRGTKGQPGAL
ncbi:MAG: adenylate/guanylate cyclase domain-containing protein [Planctomycetota bacterium]